MFMMWLKILGWVLLVLVVCVVGGGVLVQDWILNYGFLGMLGFVEMLMVVSLLEVELGVLLSGFFLQ